jgi:hypothetical protein
LLLLWWIMHFVLWEMVQLVHAARSQRSALYLGMNSNVSHSNVLGEVTRMKDGCSKNLTCMRNVPPKCNKQVTTKQQARFSLTSIN